jgi:hypothetical protein
VANVRKASWCTCTSGSSLLFRNGEARVLVALRGISRPRTRVVLQVFWLARPNGPRSSFTRCRMQIGQALSWQQGGELQPGRIISPSHRCVDWRGTRSGRLIVETYSCQPAYPYCPWVNLEFFFHRVAFAKGGDIDKHDSLVPPRA